MAININLNEIVKVKLTDLGKEIFYHQHDEFNKRMGKEVIKPKYPREDEDGYSRFQLWYFIELYGNHFGMGYPNVILPLEIIYEHGENVVRCKDCKHHSFDAEYGRFWCNRTSGIFSVKPNDYCSYGERKESKR